MRVLMTLVNKPVHQFCFETCEDINGETYSKGIVVYTVTRPAIAPIQNVMLLGMGWPGRAFPCTNCLRVVYVVNRTAEFAP